MHLAERQKCTNQPFHADQAADLKDLSAGKGAIKGGFHAFERQIAN